MSSPARNTVFPYHTALFRIYSQEFCFFLINGIRRYNISKRYNKEPVLNTTQFVILGLLSESPLSGYDIKKLIGIRFRFFWSESYGQLYPILNQLKTEGSIRVAEPGPENRPENRRRRKEYRITAAGREKLSGWLLRAPEKELTRLEILIKVYFGHLVPPETILEHVKAFGEEHSRDLEILHRFRKELENIRGVHANHPFVLATISLGIKINEAYTEWSEETQRILRSTDTGENCS